MFDSQKFSAALLDRRKNFSSMWIFYWLYKKNIFLRFLKLQIKLFQENNNKFFLISNFSVFLKPQASFLV